MLFSNVKALVFWFLQISAHCSLCPDPLALLSIFREGSGVGVCTRVMLLVFFFTIGHFSNEGEGGTGAEMLPAFASGIVNGTWQSTIGQLFPVLSNSPRSLCQS